MNLKGGEIGCIILLVLFFTILSARLVWIAYEKFKNDVVTKSNKTEVQFQ